MGKRNNPLLLEKVTITDIGSEGNAIARVKVVFVDKTGTLTKGKLKVEKFLCDTDVCDDKEKEKIS